MSITRSLLASRRSLPILIKGEGVHVTDSEGNEYLDFVGGIGAVGLGHCHPEIVKTIHEQSDKLIGTGLYYSDTLLELADKMAEIVPAPLKQSFFCNSGSEATEGAIKLALKNAFVTGKSGTGIISLMHSFHGRLGVTSAVTGRSDFKKGLFAYSAFSGAAHSPAPYCYRCTLNLSYPDCEIACANFLEEVHRYGLPGGAAAVMYEPILGVGGVIVPPDEYHDKIRKLCKENDIPLIVDEIFTGFGRTGKMFASEHWGIKPDIMCVGKILGGVGMPIAAFIASDEIAKSFDAGDHFSTFGGNPLCAKVASATIDVLKKNKIPENAERVGNYLMAELREMMKKYPMIGDVRGKGLLIGVEIVKDQIGKEPSPGEAKKLVELISKRGVLMATTGAFNCTLRLTPPLVLTEPDASNFLVHFEECLKSLT
ncbi:MAG: aspartate aminotransferase family protein [Thaumarchaeota archaeon]|nr:aspartate aminotransferase family protein [Nitrososphaerota archaeon]